MCELQHFVILSIARECSTHFFVFASTWRWRWCFCLRLITVIVTACRIDSNQIISKCERVFLLLFFSSLPLFRYLFFLIPTSFLVAHVTPTSNSGSLNKARLVVNICDLFYSHYALQNIIYSYIHCPKTYTTNVILISFIRCWGGMCRE